MNSDLDLNNWLEMMATNNAVMQEDYKRVCGTCFGVLLVKLGLK